MQKVLKIQAIKGGFLVYTNENGKTEKLLKLTLEEVVSFTQQFLQEEN